jgi:hypothetical protein
MMSWLRVDPRTEIARLHIPVLIAHGTLDAQVALSEAQMLAAAQPAAALLIIDGMNHVLKRTVSDAASQQASDPTLPVAPELIDGVANFVRSLVRSRS